MNEILNTGVIWLGLLIMAYVISCVLLVTFKTILKKKEIKDMEDNWFDNYFLIVQTIYNVIVIVVYLKKGSI
jgi:hypothetical protein